jgi:hypothetical protein
LLAWLLAAVSPAAPGVRAATPGETLTGKLVVSDVLIAPVPQLPVDATLAAAIRRVARPEVSGTGGFWRFHFVAFLSSPAPAGGTLLVRASDVTAPGAAREVRVFEVAAEPGTPQLRVNDFVVTSAMGFERGHSYELSVSPPPDDDGLAAGNGRSGGKPDVWARGVVTLR